MEERIIDDEFGRGVKLKKTKDGFVDVTDGLAEGETEEEFDGEEVEFAFPVFDTDDEELIGLTPEEIAEVQKRREEELQARKDEYASLCDSADKEIENGNKEKAQELFYKALAIDTAEENIRASVGYWSAKTDGFENPDILVDEYAEVGVENMEFDLGYQSVDYIRDNYAEKFQKARSVCEQEERALTKALEEKKRERKEYLKPQVKKKTIGFIVTLLPMLAFLTLTIVYGLNNFSVKDDRYILPTIIFGALLLVSLFVFVAFANKFINALRLYFANERLSATEEGERLIALRERLEIFDAFTQHPQTDNE